MPETIQIDLSHGISTVTPPPELSLLEGLISYRQKQFVMGGNGKITEQIEEFTLGEVDDYGHLVVATGLVPSVIDRLKAEGMDLKVNDHRHFGKRHAACQAVVSQSSSHEKHLLESAQRNPLGQIPVNSVIEMLARIDLICRYFPNARVLIPVAQKDFASLLYRQINETNPRLNVKRKRYRWPSKRPQHFIIPYASLESCVPSEWDIVLLPDALRAANNGFARAMGVFNGVPHRCYSFVFPKRLMSPPDIMRLEAMSGPTIYEITEPKSAVKVLWLRSSTAPRNTCDRRSLEWKRTTIWHNARRNEQIASVARAFAETNTSKLRGYGVRFQDGQPQFTNAVSPAIVILVDSEEHGQELLKRLKEWELVSKITYGPDRSASETMKQKILTTVCAASQGFEADVVINAAGGSGLGAFQNIVGEVAADEPGQVPALIVDFTDDYDDMTTHDTRNRSRGYGQLDWEQLNLPNKSSAGSRTRQQIRKQVIR